MLPNPARTDQMSKLTRQIHDGVISRRTSWRRRCALGLSLSAADMMFRTYRARAQDAAENPITVTVGGTPIAAMEEDLSNATPGGTLRFGRAVDSDNLDPVTNDGNVNIWYFMSIYDQLMRVGARRHLAGARTGRELGRSPRTVSPTPSTSARTSSSPTARR